MCNCNTTESKLIRAKFSQAVIMFLRQREAEEGPTTVYCKVIISKVMIMVGLTHAEMSELTPKNKVPTKQKAVNFAFNILKHMGLISNDDRGYWGLTKKGRQSRALDSEYIDAMTEIDKINYDNRKDKED